MQKEYIFEFLGTKNEFLEALNSYPNNLSYNEEKYYYFDDFIVKIIDNTIHFGVERGGHSGGYWFVPTITEYEDRIEFRGTVQYIGPDNEPDDRGKFRKAMDKIGEVLLFILFLPVILIVWIYIFIKWLIRKISKKPNPQTLEEKLFVLMENHLRCIRKNP